MKPGVKPRVSRQLVERLSDAYNPCQPDWIGPGELKDGTWLLRVARSNFERFSHAAASSVYPCRRKLTWGSLCSGSEGAAFVMHAINAALVSAGQSCTLERRFSCEIAPEKRCWIRAVSECGAKTMQQVRADLLRRDSSIYSSCDTEETAETKLPKQQLEPELPEVSQEEQEDEDEDGSAVKFGRRPGHCGAEFCFQTPSESSDQPCVFCDITTMGQVMAPCVSHGPHGSECYVPAVDLLIVGTSCKDLSKANPNKAKNKNVLSQTTSRGGSAQTFRGLLSYVDSQRPPLIVFENVDSLAEDSSSSGVSNMDVLKHEFSVRGYQAQATICEASKFGLPCRRRRLYVFFAQMVSNSLVDFQKRGVDDCFAQFRAFLSTCVRDGPCLENVLLPADDEAVLSELEARQRNSKQEPMSAVGQAEWPEAHMKFAEALGVMWSQPAGHHLQSNPWYHTLSQREKNALPLLQNGPYSFHGTRR